MDRCRGSTAGRYELRLTRQTADSTAIAVKDESFLTALRSVTYTPKATPLGRCRVATRIKASNQLNGVVEAFNAVAEALLPAWDGAVFTAPQATRKPA
jgi:hypothetical protein